MSRVTRWLPTPEAFLVIFLFLVCLRATGDSDVFLHASTGRLFLEGRIPTTDVFSHSINHMDWIAHEWLAGVGLHLAMKYGGLSLAIWLSATAAATSQLLLLWIASLSGYRRSATRTVGMFVSVLGLVYAVAPRPHMVTLVLIPLIWGMLLKYRECHKTRWLLGIPPLFALWGNCHGGFILGALPFGIVGLEALLETRPDRRDALPIVICGMASFLALTLNPQGFHLLAFPFQFDPRAKFLRSIREWQPTNYQLDVRAEIVLFLLLVFPLAWPVRVGPARGIALAASLYLCLQAVRNEFLLVQFGVPLLMASADRAFREGWFSWPAERVDMVARGKSTICAVYLTAFLCLPYAFQNNFLVPQIHPLPAASWILKNPVKPNLFNDYNSGGFLIFMLWPHYQVFIDGRAELYGRANVLNHHDVLMSQKPGWQSLLDRYRIGSALVHSDAGLGPALLRLGWHKRYDRDGWMIVERPDPLEEREKPLIYR